MNKQEKSEAVAEKHRKLSCQSCSTDDGCSSENEDSLTILQKGQNIKYKTELCRNFMETRYCPYEEKCQFAHGLGELEVAPPGHSLNDYRNRRCIKFWTYGECHYGVRCKFCHNAVKRQTMNNLKIYGSVILNEDHDFPVVSSGSRLLRDLYPTYENLYSLELSRQE